MKTSACECRIKPVSDANFARVVQASTRIDMPLRQGLGEIVYIGGGTEITRLVEDARAGKRLNFYATAKSNPCVISDL